MGNFSRDPNQELAAALDKDYVSVRFQQGKPALDREFNLAADLAAPRRLASRYLGNGIAAAGTDFAISNVNPAAGDFSIAAGRCLVDGLEAVLRTNSTFKTQPEQAGLGALPSGAYNIYLRVFEKEVTAVQDPTLANPGDVTFETAVRTKVVWQVIASAALIDRADHFLLASVGVGPLTVSDLRRQALSLARLRDDMQQTTVTKLQRVVRFFGEFALLSSTPIRVTTHTSPKQAALVTSVIVVGDFGTVSWREFASKVAESGGTTFNRGIIVQNEVGPPTRIEIRVVELVER